MRILICGLNFAPEVTGTGKYTTELAEYLVEQGNSVRVITAPPYYPQWKKPDQYKGVHFQVENWKGIELFRCPIYVPENPTGLKRIFHLGSFGLTSSLELLDQIPWKPEIVFTVAPTLLSAPAVFLYSKSVKAVSWLHIQDFELEAALGLSMLPGKRLFYPVAEKFEESILGLFDVCSTISKRMLESLRGKKVPVEKLYLLPNWVDTNQIHPLDHQSPLRGELNIPEGKFVIQYSGNMGNKQGLDTIIEAAKLLEKNKDIFFLLSGDGSSKETLINAAQGLGNLSFVPLQPTEKLNQLLNAADIHVLPQKADAEDAVMPSKLTGMMASGKPTIASALPGTEIARELSKVIRIIPPGDPKALADEINQFYYNPNSRQEYGDLGRAYAQNNWSKENILEGVLVKFQHLIKKEA
jgi:colanic acid biosynthesis glycosyl transferase WcaI